MARGGSGNLCYAALLTVGRIKSAQNLRLEHMALTGTTWPFKLAAMSDATGDFLLSRRAEHRARFSLRECRGGVRAVCSAAGARGRAGGTPRVPVDDSGIVAQLVSWAAKADLRGVLACTACATSRSSRCE